MRKHKHTEIILQPWAHYQEQEHNNLNIQNMQSKLQKINQQPQCSSQRNTPPTPINIKINENANKYNKIRNDLTAKFVKSSNKISYVVKNQENVQFYSLNKKDYTSMLIQNEPQNFIPLNTNTIKDDKEQMSLTMNYLLKRPHINLTSIGYYQNQPFTIDVSTQSKSRKSSFSQNLSTLTGKRPNTSGLIDENSKSKNMNIGQHDGYEDLLYNKNSFAGNSYHLQKMLKIRQKLRQRLKRNSQKRDIERGTYIKNTMQIEQDSNLAQPSRNFFHCTRPKTPNKNSKTNLQVFEKRKNDKWKQYIQMQQNHRVQKKTTQKHKSHFSVVGGSITK